MAKAKQEQADIMTDIGPLCDQEAIVFVAPARTPAAEPVRKRSRILQILCCLPAPSVTDDTPPESPFGANGAGSRNHLYARRSSHGVAAAGAAGGAALVSRRSSSERQTSSLRRISSKHSKASESEWFDALSQASSCPGSPTAAAAADQALREVSMLVRELPPPVGPWVPNPPLDFAEPGMRFMPVPQATRFAAYWMRDDARTTPPPQPIDVMLQNSQLVCRMHDSIPGVWIQETASQLVMTVKPQFMPIAMVRYVETFPKSGADGSWMLRRDIKPGRSTGQLYYTTEGMLIFRVMAKSLWSGTVEWISEEYMTLEDDGKVIVAQQYCLHSSSGKRAHQLLVGSRYEVPPKGHI